MPMTSVTGIPSSGGKSWSQPLTRPGALTDRPQGQRVNLAQPLGDQPAQPRSPVALWVAPVSSLPRGGPGQTMAGACDKAPDFLSPSGNQVLGLALGSTVTLNCTALVVSGPHCPLPSVQWLKDGLLLSNGSLYHLHEHSWVKTNWSEVLVSSVLGINLTRAEDFGTFTCSLQNVSSSSFTLWRADSGSVPRPGGTRGRGAGLALGPAGPAPGGAAVREVSAQCTALVPRQVWGGGDERDSPEDRKFVNFILKPQLERHRGYKLFLDDRDLLPRAEPSADLLVNLSRCRRLVVVLSDAFLGRAWCSHSFREGLCRLLELTRRPIFITFEGQRRDPVHPALRLLRQHRHLVTLLLWKPGSVTPSSDFWKELRLALPRKVQYRSMEGDPQTRLQDDKDPMLIVRGRLPEGRTLDPELDPDPEGDLGVRGPVFGEPAALPHASVVSLGEGQGSEVDVSDLGSRNYSARTDFYCLVSEDDV
ncbi:PREDICTED: single Ig IL-1-related receptor isoform X2 [Capra hircus]|uniref:single Ig IL-1-related receptor isoform X2 n=1 Tax=Capra hircus TaxID=9925 RepID=UPI00084670DD|nr:PREDICTED: single Ig IL-1-related receptor isoform X2 [Capra hircus]